MQKMYYESDEVTELDRQDEQRIAEKRKMSPEEKEKTIGLITRDGVEKAKIMIAASGEDFSRCPTAIQLCMGALIFGMLSAMSIYELGYGEWGWVKFEMAVIAGSLLGAGPEGGTEMAEYLFENSTRKQNPDVNKNIHLLIHYGIDLYFFFDQPKRLTEAVQTILQACYKDFCTGEGN